MKIVSRGGTTLADAYCSSVLGRYGDQVAGELLHTRCCSCSPTAVSPR